MTTRHFGMELEGSAFAKTGGYSHGEGRDTKPSGLYSHAEGRESESSGAAAHAEGQTTLASGANAHAEGGGCNASGASAHAEGSGSVASGLAAHSEGNTTVASAANAHAGGNRATANKFAQFARSGGILQYCVTTQHSIYPIGVNVSSTSPTALTFDGNTVSLTLPGATVLIVPYKSAVQWRLSLVGRRSDGASSNATQGFEVVGCAARDATGVARLVGTPIVVSNLYETAPLATLAIDINTTTTASNYVQFMLTNSTDIITSWTGALFASELTTNV